MAKSMFPRNTCGDFLWGGEFAKDNMANRHETEQNIRGRDATVAGNMPVHDMPDFMAALEDYKVLLEVSFFYYIRKKLILVFYNYYLKKL